MENRYNGKCRKLGKTLHDRLYDLQRRKKWADEFAKQVENDHWIMTPKVRLNPNVVAAIDVIEDIEKVSPASLFG